MTRVMDRVNLIAIKLKKIRKLNSQPTKYWWLKLKINEPQKKKKKTIWDNLTNPLNCYSGDQHNLVERKLKIIIKLNSQPNPMLKSETGKKKQIKKNKKNWVNPSNLRLDHETKITSYKRKWKTFMKLNP
jgi:predicted ATPase